MSTPAPTTTIVATETVHLTLPILVGSYFSYLSSLMYEHLGHFSPSARRRHVERRDARVGASVHVGATVDQEAGFSKVGKNITF